MGVPQCYIYRQLWLTPNCEDLLVVMVMTRYDGVMVMTHVVMVSWWWHMGIVVMVMSHVMMVITNGYCCDGDDAWVLLAGRSHGLHVVWDRWGRLVRWGVNPVRYWPAEDAVSWDIKAYNARTPTSHHLSFINTASSNMATIIHHQWMPWRLIIRSAYNLVRQHIHYSCYTAHRLRSITLISHHREVKYWSVIIDRSITDQSS